MVELKGLEDQMRGGALDSFQFKNVVPRVWLRHLLDVDLGEALFQSGECGETDGSVQGPYSDEGGGNTACRRQGVPVDRRHMRAILMYPGGVNGLPHSVNFRSDSARYHHFGASP